MNVNLSITFDREEILAMCQERCDRVQTPVPGRFEVSDYFGSVRAEFIPAEVPAEADISSPTSPPSAEEISAPAAEGQVTS